MTTESTVIATCECGTQFETEAWCGDKHCTACLDTRQAAFEAAEREALAARFQEERERLAASILQEIPDRLRNSDRSDPRWNAALASKVDRWKPDQERPWLGLVGRPGTCKSRLAYETLSRVAQGLVREYSKPSTNLFRPAWDTVSGPEFKRLVMAQFSSATLTAGHWQGGTEKASDAAVAALRSIRTADVLLFDEIGEKNKATPAFMEAMFDLIDFRHAHNLVTIWTANSSPEMFCASWSEEFAAPIAGRIIESSTILTA